MKIRKSKKLDNFEFYAFDIETYENNLFRLGCIYKDGIGKMITDLKQFFDYFINLNENEFIIYSHFGGGFDFLYLLDVIFSQYKIDTIKFCDSQGILIYIRCKLSGKVFHFRDSYSLFRCSLNKVAENLLAEKKLEVEIENRDSISTPDLYTYCEYDCYLLYYSLMEYWKLIDYEEIKISIGSQAMDFFCKYFLKQNWLKTNNFEYNQLKNFYYGGRVDVFRRYGQNINVYDINNCYGYCMKQFGAPVGNATIGNTKSLDKNIAGFYVVKINDRLENYVPFTPLKFGNNSYNQKLYFLNSNTQHFFLTSNEIKLLDFYNINYYIIKAFEYDLDLEFFKKYIEYWEQKIYINKKCKFIAKLFINSLYGKFGEQRIRKNFVYGKNVKQYLNEYWNLGYQDKNYSYNEHSEVQIAAWVTSCARTNALYPYLRKYRENLFYCDTDSLMLNCEIDKEDLNHLKFGKLKFEGNYKEAIFLTQKFYMLNDNLEDKSNKVCIKGFERKDYDFSKFKNALHDDIQFDYTKSSIVKFKTALKKNKWIDFKETHKEIKTIEIKRRLLDDKINTVPYELRYKKLI
jgi:hypothetical protein